MSNPVPPPPIIRLCDLKHNERGTFFALLAERTKGATREGKLFFTCRFRDSRRKATYMVWGDGPHYRDCESVWQPGQFFKINAKFQDHEKFGAQIDVSKIRSVEARDAVDGFDPDQLGERSRFDSDAMFTELRELLTTEVSDEPLRDFAFSILDRNADKIKQLPASPRHFHPFPGGWLEHTLSVARNCLWLVDRYRAHYPDLEPPLNRDLVVIGAALHEIGRVTELEPSAILGEPAEPTIEGRLFGHLIAGRDLIRDAAREHPAVNPELVRLLEHMLLTYLSVPEWGSPRLPLIPEVLILHHADDLDAKMEMYARCLSKDLSPGPFTERDPLLGRHLLKARSV